MQTILQYVSSMGLYMLIVLPFVVVYRVIVWRRREKKNNLNREIAVIAFLAYCIGLFSQTIIPKWQYSATTIDVTTEKYNAVNTELFRVITETYNAIVYIDLWEPFLINFLGNIVMFIPIGFFVSLLFRRGDLWYVNIFIGFLLSLMIEILQLPQMRSSDVDDLWLNTLGTLIGWAIIPIVPERIRRKFRRAA